MDTTREINLGVFDLILAHGVDCGFKLKREATVEEVRFIMMYILGIVLYELIDVNDQEEYDAYNNELTSDFNKWLAGDYDDQCLMDYADTCSDEQLGLFNTFGLTEYLLHKGII